MTAIPAEFQTIDRGRLHELLDRERARYVSDHPRSHELSRQAQTTLLGGVPMSMMGMLSGAFPLFCKGARGNRMTDVDGHTYVDLCLGDGGAMTGHSPAAVVDAVRRHLDVQGGLTTMLPTEDAAFVGAELARRFGLPYWQFALTATDANRWVLRMCRMVQRRPLVLVFSHCYHGSVDETIVVVGPDGAPMAKPGNVGPQVDPTQTTKVVEFNDLEALRAALSPRDVAAVLMEPVMTNIGIVPPEAGFLEAVRTLCDATGTLLINDETHTLSAGVGGCTRAYGLRPDVVTVGKAIASGIPMGAYGVSAELAGRILGDPDADLVDTGGRRRHPGRQRALHGGHARDARARAHGAQLRAHDRPRDALLRGRAGCARSVRSALGDRAARRPRRVSLLPRGAAQRRPVMGSARRRTRRAHAPLHAESRHLHDAVPQRGTDVPRHDGRGRRPPLGRLPRGGPGAALPGDAAVTRTVEPAQPVMTPRVARSLHHFP